MSWLHRPQRTRLRKVIFALHQWSGLLLGLYVTVVCVSGSVAVFRPDVNRALIPRRVEEVRDARLADAELRAALAAQYPGYEIVRIGEARRPESLVYVTLARGGKEIERLADPYTGKVVGDPYPPAVRAIEWTVRLHDELLIGPVGRKVNGVAGALVAVLVVTGVVVWWPGTKRWPIGLVPSRRPSAPGAVWQLHAIVGIWCAALLGIWGVTGLYFGFPQPFEGLIDRFDDDLNDLYRPGEALLLGMLRLHFGRFQDFELRIAWGVLGLLPAVLFVSGFWLWWRRTARRLRARSALREQRPQIDDGGMSAGQV